MIRLDLQQKTPGKFDSSPAKIYRESFAWASLDNLRFIPPSLIVITVPNFLIDTSAPLSHVYSIFLSTQRLNQVIEEENKT